MKTTQNADAEIKVQVVDYWDNQPCGTQFSESDQFTLDYFEEIEEHRYRVETAIFPFAQFSRFHGKDVLEVGVGAGTDFLQWVRSGARAHGIDVSSESVATTQKRLAAYGFDAADLRVGDCEHLPYADNSFDLVYSFGVIHHTPDTPQALREIVRVCKPKGRIKVMIYHRHSLLSYFFWIKWCLLRGRPWKSLSWCLANHMESPGTKAYTVKEAARLLAGQPVRNVSIYTVLTYYDRLERFGGFARAVGRFAAWLLGGNRVGWFLMIEAERV
ncbi:MAG: class I SAM-dependent methyltransferase [Bacteroidetes bacterium]|nr:class I SAM-dependent methyltransferase [Bacteroidota bacterium]